MVYVDYVKAVAIYMVMLSHTAMTPTAAKWINVFHVPLFFFVSGFLFSYERNPSLRRFAAKKAFQLLLPYISISAVSYLFWLFIGRHYGSDVLQDMPLYRPFVSSLYVDVGGMVHNLPLWFFPSLFVVSVFCHRTMRRINGVALLLLSLAAGYGIYEYVGYLPFAAGQSVVAVAFYVMGYMFRDRKITLPYPLAALFLPLSLCGIWLNDKVAMYHNWYGSFPLFVVFAVAGICFVLILCRALQRVLGERRVVRLVSDNTLAVCGFHLMVFTMLKGVMFYIFRTDLSVLDGTFLPNIAFSLAALALCVPLSVLLRRYVPWLVGVR